MSEWEPSFDPYALRIEFGIGLGRRNMGAICPDIPSRRQIERDLDDLRETDPDSYAFLSEHIEVEKYREETPDEN